MPTIKVTYMKEVVERIDWPEDEMADFNYETLQVNLGRGEIQEEENELDSISSVLVDGEEYEF